MNSVISVKNLVKVYDKVVRALNGISLEVQEGEIFGLLGPNGAGKTTLVRILTTQIPPTGGEAFILGKNIIEEADKVRELIGYVPQEISVMTDLTGYENMLFYSKLYDVPSSERKRRIENALNLVGLLDKANVVVKNYSGGMMRRLEIAQAIINYPKILFLDEPTIGLDPSGRKAIWSYLSQLMEEHEMTILMTTHYMDEADMVTDRLAIINFGKIVAVGTPSELKKSTKLESVTIVSKLHSNEVKKILSSLPFVKQVYDEEDGKGVTAYVENAEEAVVEIISLLKENSVNVESLSMNKPTLDDVFLAYAGTKLEETTSALEARKIRRTMQRMR
ncbi:MAG: ATP-binding cassette domain-containing protein [Thermoproteota archaeon]|nr:ATP-binding cassette domain-containing protein [Candidatus Brockarchaeota archaeon]MBO3768309.1 ATP-binding cassette domain-containing protein [Candidatus Brockarchaeota archaeon]MBO3800920.1 ATP-binding cassette domain-containing protein [Candidatus Brockarchaeota archaeon]